MRWFRIWLVAGACALLQGAACNVLESHSCTEIGCANGVGVSAEDLVRAVVSDQLGAAPREDFEQVAARLLEKNRELYRRLA